MVSFPALRTVLQGFDGTIRPYSPAEDGCLAPFELGVWTLT